MAIYRLFHQGLVARTTLAVAGVGGVLFCVVALLTYLMVRNQTLAVEQVRAQSIAQIAATRIEARLLHVLTKGEALSRNIVIRNALLDSAGREVYVASLLQAIVQLEGAPLMAALLDFQAQPLLQVGELPLSVLRLQPWLQQQFNFGASAAHLVSEEKTAVENGIVLIYPILWPQTQSIEGGLLFYVPFEVLLTSLGAEAAYTLQSQVTASRPMDAINQAQYVSIELRVPEPLLDRHLLLTTTIPPGHLMHNLVHLKHTYAVMAISIIVILILISIVVARKVAQPIRQLATLAQEIARTGYHEAIQAWPSWSSGEIGMLTQALQHMLQQLRVATDRERYGLELQFRTIFDGMHDGALIVDSEGRIRAANPAIEQIFGFQPQTIIGHHIALLLGEEPLCCPHALDTQTPLAQRTGRHQDGHTIPLEWSRNPISHVEGSWALVLLRDISERQRAAAQMEASLREKEVLLQEIHHRVKNNLTIVSSLLALQAAPLRDPQMRAAFQDSQQRVQAMALVHEQLYKTVNLSHIDLGTHLRTLASNIAATYRGAQRDISLQLELANIAVELDVAIPVSLLLNELLTNAWKHAFPKRSGGCVEIRLTQDTTAGLLLSVRDDGVGLPPGLAWDKTSSLGLKLVRTLGAQLRAKIEVQAEHGTTFHVWIPQPIRRAAQS